MPLRPYGVRAEGITAACCRRCEFWLPGTLDLIETADVGECLNKHSDRDRPPADHCCPHYSEDANVYDRRPERRSA